MKNLIAWNFDNTYSSLPNILLSKIRPEKVFKPKLIIKNDSLADELGLNLSNVNENELSLLFSGNTIWYPAIWYKFVLDIILSSMS